MYISPRWGGPYGPPSVFINFETDPRSLSSLSKSASTFVGPPLPPLPMHTSEVRYPALQVTRGSEPLVTHKCRHDDALTRPQRDYHTTERTPIEPEGHHALWLIKSRYGRVWKPQIDDVTTCQTELTTLTPVNAHAAAEPRRESSHRVTRPMA